MAAAALASAQPPPARARPAQARARAVSLAALWRGEGSAHTHVSPWTTRRLSGGGCVPLPHWLPGEPFTFYPALAANRLPPFIAWERGARELRRVEFSERACAAGVGWPPLVWAGGVGAVLRLRRAGSAVGREGEEEAVPGPGEWRNLTVGGSEAAAAGKWRRRHNETRPVVGGKRQAGSRPSR